MNALQNKALLYDRDCPMCNMYTGYFVNTGILSDKGRIAFDDMTAPIRTQIDHDRARHEIALVDYTGGTTMYGLEGLFHIVGTKAPFLKPLLGFRPFQIAMTGLYKVITYNRRLMAGKAGKSGPEACKPDFNLPWRVTYLLLALLIALPIFNLAGNAIIGATYGAALPLGIGAALVLQAAYSLRLPFEARMDYMGNLATLLIISSIVVLPAPLISAINGVPLTWMYLGLLGIGQYLMHRDHFRRLKSFGLPKALGFTWIAALIGSGTFLAFLLA